MAEVRELGYRGLTVRSVARRSGVAAATAYTYFSSKEHLVAEVFWRRISDQVPRPLDRRRSTASRVTDVLLDFALVVADEAELAAATTVALLVDDPEVHELRVRIGRELRTRLQAALGDDGDERTVRALELLLSGALIHAGTGHLRYADLPDRLAESAGLLLGAAPRASTDLR